MSSTNTASDIERVDKKLPYPKSIIFIIGNEFCERFSYYGMRTILVLYFRYVLSYSEDSATQAFHIFAMACYFTPVLGAIIADSYLGKFLTIFIISIVYAVGNILLSFASVQGTTSLSFIGLALIAIGTGGIKPCVSAFGGDQFKPEQKSQLESFFSLFYMSINAGSLISTYVTPILRQDYKCFDRDDCYPLAFGVPAVLMVAALVLFILGKFITNYVIVPPSKPNIVFTVIQCICHAIGRRFSSGKEKRDHWLDYADDKFSAKTINDVKALMGILFLYIPLPIFWALFDQQASRWTLQAVRMNGQLGSIIIKPDQIQVINPILVLVFIPVFEYIVYPVLKKFGLGRPLQRMTIGGVLAAIAFVVCALFQLKIETEDPTPLLANHKHVALMNSLDCTVDVQSDLFNATIEPFHSKFYPNIEQTKLANFAATFNSSCKPGETFVIKQSLEFQNKSSLVLFISEQLYQKKIQSVGLPNILVKSSDSGADFFTVFNLANMNNNTEFKVDSKALEAHVEETIGDLSFGYIDKFEVEVIGEDVRMHVGDDSKVLDLGQGATCLQMITGDVQQKNLTFSSTQLVEENKVSVFLQLIQYLIITAAEIMFSITGLEFSYSQAPASMKSVLQAAWLLTVAFGNLIVAVIADLKLFEWQSYEFFFFGGLMLVDIAIFALMAYYYVPVVQVDADVDNDALGKPDQLRLDSLDKKVTTSE